MPLSNENLVSIITPVCNGQRFLVDAIESVLDQTYPYWEMLIINDNSSDRSPSIAASYAEQDKRIKVIDSDQSVGAAKARNLGISAASGRYIGFLDADDCWLPEKLQKQITFMSVNNYAFTYTGYEKIDSDGSSLSHAFAPPFINRKLLLTKKHIGCLTVIYDTMCLGKVEMPLIGKRQDLGLWLRLLKYSKKAHGLKECLARYRIHDESMSANKVSAALFTWHLFRKHEGMSVPVSVYYFSWYVTSRVLRRALPGLAARLGFE